MLYTLCDSNEFRANALMRSASASFGKMEADRNNVPPKESSLKAKGLANAVLASQALIPELEVAGTEKATEEHKENQHKYGSQKYATYMQNRVRLYKRTFKEGTKEQKRLFRKLQKRALLWQSFKAQDNDLIRQFADNNLNIMRSVEATDTYKSAMGGAINYTGTQIDPSGNQPAYSRDALFGMLQEKLKADGLLSPEQMEGVKNISDLFKKVQETSQAVKDPLSSADEHAEGAKAKIKKNQKREKPVTINSKTAQRFWDRLYGGADFDWENSTGYYPDGLGITLTGGYHISDNSGLNIEVETLLNGSKMGFREDLRFESTLVSNYTVGANIDYRLWKFLFAGIGSELIINTIEAPAIQTFNTLRNTDYTLGIPLIAKAILPIGGAKSTQIQFSYDLNSHNNIKPKFDFKVGFLIGR